MERPPPEADVPSLNLPLFKMEEGREIPLNPQIPSDSPFPKGRTTFTKREVKGHLLNIPLTNGEIKGRSVSCGNFPKMLK